MDERYEADPPVALTREKTVFFLFRFGILAKGLISLLEIASAAAVLLIPPGSILSLADFLTRGELAEDPTDLVATHIHSLALSYVNSTTFLAVYLFSRGIIKLFLIFALLKNKLWAYPAALVVLGLFVLYQLYQLFATHSGIVALITVFDLIVIFLIWKEYQIVKNHGGKAIA